MQLLEQYGYFRAAVATPELRVADVDFNVRAIVECMERADDAGVRLLVLPELSLTGYTCGDLFYQRHLLEAAREGLGRIAEASSYEPLAVLVGLPMEVDNRLYNCAALVCSGDVLGVVPKTHLPNSAEFYERRWFASGEGCACKEVGIGSLKVPFGTDVLFRFLTMPACVIGVELCEDLWAVQPPSGEQALAGATVLANLSASDELLGKADYRRLLVRQQSARCLAGYLYAASGPGESSTDVVYSGHGIVAENGQLLAEQERFAFDSMLTITDIDVQRLVAERTRNSSFCDTLAAKTFRVVDFNIPESDRPTLYARDALQRPVNPQPFVPADDNERAVRCEEIFALQSTALARRVRHLGAEAMVLGVSGGLDSTLALLVAAKAFDCLGLPRKGIHTISMPGLGTTERTRANAQRLAELLGVSFQTVSIVEAVRQHFKDIGHDEAVHDRVYENAQARERTQVLMDLANALGGFVVGTSDLSETALGWCTFNADHMSMYHVNIGVPKTLVRYLVEWCAQAPFHDEAAEVLGDIVETPITPELLPPGENGELVQETEKSIGPYELHDFFLYHAVRHACAPAKVAFLAEVAFAGRYERAEVLRWLEVFYTRFFAQQYKRNAMPDGPKIGTVALSPRGDWRMPSDASGELWLAQVRQLQRAK